MTLANVFPAVAKHFRSAVAVTATLVALGTTAQAGPTLDAVKAKGFVQCGVTTGLAGFSVPDSTGRWIGMDVDVCRAVAAAIFGDAEKVKFTPLSAQQRFPAIQSGEVDILSRNTTWTLGRDTQLGLNFGPVVYYDGQGFLVPRKLGATSTRGLDGATACIQSGTTNEQNITDYFRARGLTFRPVVFEAFDEVLGAFFSGRCDIFTADSSQLASIRAAKAGNPEDYLILQEIISKEPLAPAVRHGDDQWFDILKWSVYAMIQAEELGITSKNVEQFLESKNPEIQRMLGVVPGNGRALNVDEKWAFNIIKQVGNYGEVFERNIGAYTPLRLDRGLNALWTKGGLQYAPPIR